MSIIPLKQRLPPYMIHLVTTLTQSALNKHCNSLVLSVIIYTGIFIQFEVAGIIMLRNYMKLFIKCDNELKATDILSSALHIKTGIVQYIQIR